MKELRLYDDQADGAKVTITLQFTCRRPGIVLPSMLATIPGTLERHYDGYGSDAPAVYKCEIVEAKVSTTRTYVPDRS